VGFLLLQDFPDLSLKKKRYSFEPSRQCYKTFFIPITDYLVDYNRAQRSKTFTSILYEYS